ncbi:cornichon-like protein, putative [Bodo saltans]|uniref:Cornichon-like protein, putative n=1 Tax=Bodo saltans TaxID=75058 RepID=A0A0S4JDG0_BODSA|nr:cornichon-like protein, putative [Bodo saltans]|eukprot:CUG89610.1 cornichon-like protein, putative [Bodo saltans]
MLWMTYVLGIVGLWVAGCLTQTMLAAVVVHVMLCVSDIDYVNAQSRASFCESCTTWFRVEYVLSVAQVVITWFSAPHWPLSLLLTAYVAYETYISVTFPDRRTLDTVTIYRYKTSFVKETAIRVGVNVVLFLLYLFYVGAFTILYMDPTVKF